MYSPAQLVLLFGAGLAAGFVDAIAGGGGLITLPILLSVIPDPKVALGTNKLQSTFGSASAALHYAAAGLVSWRESLRAFIITCVFAAAGVFTLQYVSNSALRRVTPVILGLVVLYVLFKPKLGESPSKPLLNRASFDLLFGMILGFYDGFFGPGTGTFWTIALVLVAGMSLQHATASTKVLNFASNVSSLAIFLIAGQVLFTAGLVMAAGQILGARLGSKMVVTRGAQIIRPILIGASLLLTIKLLLDAFHHPSTR
jgi:uncharacterized membrane protein YfcA